MKGPASPGQQVSTGRKSREASSPSSTTSWQGASFTLRGAKAASSLSLGRALSRRAQSPWGSSRRMSSRRRPEMSSRSWTPRARAMRRRLPKRLMARGQSAPFTFSKSSAGPPAFITGSLRAVISR